MKDFQTIDECSGKMDLCFDLAIWIDENPDLTAAEIRNHIGEEFFKAAAIFESSIEEMESAHNA